MALLGHIIPIPSKSVFVLFPYCCVLSREATNTNVIVFGLTQSGFVPSIYHTRGEHANHYATDAILFYTINTSQCSIIPERGLSLTNIFLLVKNQKLTNTVSLSFS